MKRTNGTGLAVMVLCILLYAASLRAGELRIAVAASMTDVFKELAADFSTRHPEVKILPNFGPSGGLARQIDQGAPADLYVSANPKWMDFLVERGRIATDFKATFAYNTLVFVGRKNDAVSSLADLAALERIAVGSPKSVPAGQYAQQAMTKAGLYDRLLDAGKLVMAKDVRQALIYADRGETDGAFVYRTDALLAKRAVVLFEVPLELYDRVTCPVALTREGSGKEEARKLFAYITSAEAERIIAKYGFTLPE